MAQAHITTENAVQLITQRSLARAQQLFANSLASNSGATLQELRFRESGFGGLGFQGFRA